MAESKDKAASTPGAVSEETPVNRLWKYIAEPVPESVNQTTDADTVVRRGGAEPGAVLLESLDVFISMMGDQRPEKIDKALLDAMIAKLDAKLSAQLDEILHAAKFQEIESAWRGLKHVVDRTDFTKNVRIEMLNSSKGDLLESFEDAPEITQSGLYQHLYTNAYDRLGGDPYSAVLSNYTFDKSPQDIALLRDVSKVAAAAICPFLGAMGPEFFGKETFEEVNTIKNLKTHLSNVEYTQWNSFRDSEDSRYVGLAMPRYLSRSPYGKDSTPVKTFGYEEEVVGGHDKYLWSSAAYPMAANLIKAFVRDGFTVQIRGKNDGGKVAELPMHLYDLGKGKEAKIPTEVSISETEELEKAELGFMPLCHWEKTDFSVFLSANSTQRPKDFGDETPERAAATANSKINARLPYILLASRIAHYMKVQQRENIGSSKAPGIIQSELQEWMDTLIIGTPNPTPSLIAKRPLKGGSVTVTEVPGDPGVYRVDMEIMPHFQVEGFDVRLSLVSRLDTK